MTDHSVDPSSKIHPGETSEETKARIELGVQLGTEHIDALSLERQVVFYKECIIQMRQELKAVLPYLRKHDSKLCYLDDGFISHDVERLMDLRKTLIRTLSFPSRTLADNNLPEGLTPDQLWNICLDLVLEMNRDYGITTGSTVKVPHAVLNVISFGRCATNPLEKIEPSPKTLLYRALEKVFGAKRLKGFVDRNSDLHRPRWMRRDVLDD